MNHAVLSLIDLTILVGRCQADC